MLGQWPLLSVFIKLFIPAVIGMMVQALYSVVDRYFIGNIPDVGQIAIGGVGVTMPIGFIFMGISMLFGIGAASNISIFLGRDEKENASITLANALFAMLVVGSIVSSLVLIFSTEILVVLGATEENLPYALKYLRILTIASYWNYFAFGFNHLIRAEGASKHAMLSMVLSAIINTVLDAIFVLVFNWGIAGAAYATLIAQAFAFIWGASYYFTGKSTIGLSFKNFTPNLKIIFLVISIGFSPFFMQIASAIIGAIFNNSLKIYGGSTAQGAYAIISAIMMLFFMPVFSINQALQPIVGFNYGAKNYQRVKKANLMAIVGSFIIFTISWIFAQFFTSLLVNPMARDPELNALTIKAVKTSFLVLPIIGIQIINSNYFQSIGKAKIAFFISMSRQILLLVPLLLILPKIYGLDGIWYAIPISDTGSVIISLTLMLKSFKRLGEQLN